MLKKILLIGIGGFAGSVLRYYVSRLNLSFSIFSIPLGTLLVNVTGSLVLGFLIGIADKSNLLTLEWRLFLMVGICGGFTTFSSFAGENLILLHEGQIFQALLYIILSVSLGLFAVYLGYLTSNLL